ncbi:MAG TPA: CapA family protein, partial [Propionibacteriaceae bacterium]|nr:CapA family protein [Propionibacteriaceae bacterium]
MPRRRSAAGLAAAMVGTLLFGGYLTEPAERSRAAVPATPAATDGTTPTPAAPRPTPRPSATPTPGPSPRATPAPTPVTATLVMNGDLLWHNSFWYGAREDARRRGRSGYDFAPVLAGIRPVVAGADLAICHQEPPLGPARGPFANYPRFSVPPQVVPAIKATGYDVCTTASNHSVDRGFSGLKRTLDALDRAGIAHSGTARTAAEARRPTIVTTRAGVRVAVISGTFSTNGIPEPPGKPWSVTGLEPRGLVAKARQARVAGADIVVVAAHVGTEFSSRVNAQQRRLARTLTASPHVDLVYMHHTHVVQPWAKVNGKWVIYGLGNTVAQHETDIPQGAEGVTARLRFERGRNGRFTVTRAEYIPTLVTRYAPGRPSRLHQVSVALPKARGAFRERLRVAQRRTTAVVTR